MSLPILTYHSIDESRSVVSVSPARFREHIARLNRAGYRGLSLSGALRHLGAGKRSDRVVAITFDDGYRSVYTHALPVLEEYGWPATVFPVADHVGDTNRWPGQPDAIPSAELLSWAQLAQLAQGGWEIGAHGRSHVDLTDLSEESLSDEILGPRRMIEERLKIQIDCFAYPYGRHDPRVRERVREAYRWACTTDMGLAGAASNPMALERVDMYYFSQAITSTLIASIWMEPYVAVRGAMRAIRRAVVTG